MGKEAGGRRVKGRRGRGESMCKGEKQGKEEKHVNAIGSRQSGHIARIGYNEETL